ncbi:PREDICTED: U4/U6.U5 small nuclear ribonucleoprotein 27 kDa protein [Propithecus coquereli]|uniref:U4/U6.U5 small nuclear ribonucleoprotein 27 kDa protein n=1 Tax=Propithecus coquereli TaxID=379532 RepID=UPI00063F6FA3|nr:PREDICTED: U4/U6.U5 small nuclear ribonucleoprotein 27 kDa protein [Propithecus coquereli]
MGRSRSRSPRRERRRSRSTSRERDRRRRERSRSRERERRRSRSRSPHRRRSRSPRRHRSTSPSPSRLKERRDEEKKETKETKSKERQITEEDLEGKTEEEIEMMKLMGFASFDSTKRKNAGRRQFDTGRAFPLKSQPRGARRALGPSRHRRAAARLSLQDDSRRGPGPEFREVLNLGAQGRQTKGYIQPRTRAEQSARATRGAILPFEGCLAGPQKFSPGTGLGNRSEAGPGGADFGSGR